MLLVNRRGKSAKTYDAEQSAFGMHSLGVSTNRDEWVYDASLANLNAKAEFFAGAYNDLLDKKDSSYPPVIKWSRDLRNEFRRGRRITHTETSALISLYRPFITKNHFADFTMNDVLTRYHYEILGDNLLQSNKILCFSGIASNKPFSALATNRLFSLDMLEKTQCLPLYRYTEDGERVCNITDWAIQHINDYYTKRWGKDFHDIYPDGISAEEIFAYTYAVLHDPVYRHDYKVDLLREFPRLPLYHDFDLWAKMGRELLDLHIGFESAEPYPLKRVDGNGQATRAILRADKERGIIVLDDKTTLSGVPSDAWRYMLGSRSALEWVLDQYKEKKPRDPTIRERFNTYRFADYKERVIDLLRRVCTVSVRTMDVIDDMAYWDDDKLIVFGDRDQNEWGMLGLSQWANEAEDPEWEAAWLET